MNRPLSIGKVKSFYGNFGVLVRAYTYIKTMGAEGLKRVSELAVLNANYMKEELAEYFELPYEQACMHEFVLSRLKNNPSGITTKQIAKATAGLWSTSSYNLFSSHCSRSDDD
jgi:glycine dehydrogenase subunit 2